MSKLKGNPNIETRMILRVSGFVHSYFVIISSFIIRHSSFS